MLKFVSIIFFLIALAEADNCVPRSFSESSVVCVCNATYCDSIKVDIPPQGTFQTYVSGQNGQRLVESTGNFQAENGTGIHLALNVNKTYQSINGFGGAFTDSAGINIKTLSEAAQEQLLKTYFSPEGSRYNLGRIPIGGTDFSTKPYSLDDHDDDNSLSQFSLTREDSDYKMPFMQKALALNPELRFVAASWSAPPWMKTNNDCCGVLGFLKKKYYQTYADYLVKFLDDYKRQGLPIWAMSTGNEPANVFTPSIKFNDMGWLPTSVANWVVNNLGPTIANSTSNETLILSLDDQRFSLPWYIDAMYKADKNVDKYMAGIAVHWYADRLFPVTLFDRTHSTFPNKFLLMTEACTGSLPWEFEKVRLGSWSRAERYIKSIIDDLNHWVTGWIDWNLALDKKGGPNWVGNNVDSSIIVNPETDEFFKQPMFYAIAHFSKFVPRESVRVELSTEPSKIKSIAFLRPDNAITIVLYNCGTGNQSVIIADPDQGNINVEIPGKSIMTIIYQQ